MRNDVTNVSLHRNSKKSGGDFMNRKKKKLLVIALLLLFGITAGYVANTYAKYTAQVSGSGNITVAKWAFEEDNDSISIDIDLDDAFDVTTLAGDRIAPGTSGSFDIELSNANSEVGVDFTITLTNSNAPANLTFTTGSTITGQIAAGGTLTVPVEFEWPYSTGDADDAEDTTDGENGGSMTITANIVGTQVQPGTTAITSHVN